MAAGQELAKRAVEADGAGRLSEARDLYHEAAESLLNASRGQQDPGVRKRTEEFVAMYLDRVQQIDRQLGNVVAAPAPAACATTPATKATPADPYGLGPLPKFPALPKFPPLPGQGAGGGPPRPSSPAAASPPKGGLTARRKKLFDEAFHVGERAKRLEEDRKFGLAVPLFREAAQLFVEFMKDETDEEARELVRVTAKDYVRRAELIQTALEADAKKRPPQPAAVPAGGTAELPSGRLPWQATLLQFNKLSPEEVAYLLGEGSTISGMQQAIWDDPKLGFKSHQPFHVPGRVFEDDYLPGLSKKQIAQGAVWMRASEWLPRGVEPCVMPAVLDPEDICQSVVGDCSYVCSLIVCANYEQRNKGARLISSAIHPQGPDARPVYNPSGKYAVKLLLNGVVRCVVVDDRCVVAKGKGWVGGPKGGHAIDVQGHAPLCAHSAAGHLWVSLCEKAFLKVHGGSYDFPGSSSSSDLYALCGWIPETVEMEAGRKSTSSGVSFDKDKEWERLYRAHHKGSLLATISTPEQMPQEWQEKLGLVPCHAYSVLDFQEACGRRLLRVMNPWRQQRWLGRFSHQDNVNWTAELREALDFDKRAAKEQDTGVFWIDWNDVAKFFGRLSLSWNPHRFKYRWAMHYNWRKQMDENNHFGRCPQFHLSSEAEEETVAWLLICRHMLPKAEPPNSTPYITLHVVDTKGLPPTIPGADSPPPRRVPSMAAVEDARLTHHGTYRNSPQHLVRLTLPKGRGSFTVVASMIEVRPFPFTLTLYSPLQSVSILRLPDTPYEHCKTLKGEWKGRSAAGRNMGSTSNWRFNPQFRIVVAEPAPVCISLELGQKHSVGLDLVRVPDELLRAQGTAWQGRMQCLLANDTVWRSGPYTKSCAHLDSTLPPPGSKEDAPPPVLPKGAYCIIPSTFEPGKEAAFRLDVYSPSAAVAQSLRPVGVEGQGMQLSKLSAQLPADGPAVFRLCVFSEAELCARLHPDSSAGEGGPLRVVRLLGHGGAELASSATLPTFPALGAYLPLVRLPPCTKHEPYRLECLPQGAAAGAPISISVFCSKELHVLS
eukprot:TRINITY_DN4814_c0_g1_i5.p1 TRINITY_DN4814_c0_g1~~TRINITY_DN4814_c0_g1_i5.p1  ORF type:complete len:1091 (+),score=364.72 TRINITY_DN4814_c0_g1_i5:106-3273(+)